MDEPVTFEAPDLATRLEMLASHDLAGLDFGVIGLDADDRVRVYSSVEAQQSGYGTRPPIGLEFFETIAPCMNTPLFRGRIASARAAGNLDIRFSHVGDFGDAERVLHVRVVAASDGGIWILHQREAA